MEKFVVILAVLSLISYYWYKTGYKRRDEDLKRGKMWSFNANNKPVLIVEDLADGEYALTRYDNTKIKEINLK